MSNLASRTITVNCPKCGALAAHLHFAAEISQQQADSYRDFVLRVHNDAEHSAAVHLDVEVGVFSDSLRRTGERK
jgi:hypothetical protein